MGFSPARGIIVATALATTAGSAATPELWVSNGAVITDTVERSVAGSIASTIPVTALRGSDTVLQVLSAPLNSFSFLSSLFASSADGVDRSGELLKNSAAVGDNDWLRKWLASLSFSIPTQTIHEAGLTITISNGLCSQISVVGVSSSVDPSSIMDIRAHGLGIGCKLHFEVEGITSGDVDAQVGDSDIGGKIAFTADTGHPQLPQSIKAYACAGTIKVTDLHFSGGVVAKLLDLLSGVIENLLSKSLAGQICTAVDTVINEKGPQALSNVSAQMRQFLEEPSTSPAPPHLPPPDNDYATFSSNSGIELLEQIVGQFLGNFESGMDINLLLSLALGKSGSLGLSGLGNVLTKKFDVDQLGSINITINDLALAGLNTWTKLNFSTPVERQLALDMALKNLAANASVRLEVSFDGSSSSPMHGQKLVEIFNLTAKLNNFGTSACGFIALDTTKLEPLSIDQYGSIGCLTPALYSAMETSASLNLDSMQPTLTPLGGDSLEQDTDRMINLVVGSLLNTYREAVEALANKAVSVKLRDTLNKAIDEQVHSSSPRQCAAPEQTYVFPAVTHVGDSIAVALIIASILWMVSYKFFARHAKGSARRLNVVAAAVDEPVDAPVASLTSSTSSPSTGAPRSHSNGASSELGVILGPVDRDSNDNDGGAVSMLRDGHQVQRAIAPDVPAPSAAPARMAPCGDSWHTAGDALVESRSSWQWDCLAFDRNTSKELSLGLPLLCVTNICLFVASNAGVGTSVMLSLLVNDRSVLTLPPVKQFGLINSVKDMWDGGVYPLAMFICFFSGMWPYIKMGAMLVCWYMPVRLLSPERRYQGLRFLDAFGKWSLVDTYVLVMMMVAFRFQLQTDGNTNPIVATIVEELQASASLTLFVQPGWGFHGFLAATLSSLVLGHVMCACHRYAHGIAEFAPMTSGVPTGKYRLCDVGRPGGWAGVAYSYGVIVALVTSLILVLYGIFDTTFQFTFEGLAAFALGPEDSVRAESAISLALAIPESTADSNSFGIRWIQFMFMFFTFIVTAAYHVILIALWGVPMHVRHQRHMFVAAQVMNAWSALDVFVVSILASVLEISLFIQIQIIGPTCHGLNPIIEKLPFASKIPGSPTCYNVVSELQHGFIVLLLATIICTVTGQIVLARCSKALVPPPESS